VVPAARRMSVETLAKLLELQRRGVRLVFTALPEDVPGLGRLAQRRLELQKLLAEPALRAVVASNVPRQLAKLGVRREGAAVAGLGFIRRARADGYDYFFANLAAAPFDGWLTLATPARSALLLDPLAARVGAAALRRGADGQSRVYLQLASGESMLLRTQRAALGDSAAPPWRYLARASDGVTLAGDWGLTFLKGGPVLPAAAQLRQLASWTLLPDAEAQRFAGTARYRIEFDAPAQPADDWLLELGDVRESARVRLNGEPMGTAWSLPFSLRLGATLKPRDNVLEIEVSNLPANRIRDLERRKVDWKIMQDINLASLHYGAFDASQWDPAPSGLLGPVRLVPLKLVRPR